MRRPLGAQGENESAEPKLNPRHQRFLERHRHAGDGRPTQGEQQRKQVSDGRDLLYSQPLPLSLLSLLREAMARVTCSPSPSGAVTTNRTSQVHVLSVKSRGQNPSDYTKVAVNKMPADGGSPAPRPTCVQSSTPGPTTGTSLQDGRAQRGGETKAQWPQAELRSSRAPD